MTIDWEQIAAFATVGTIVAGFIGAANAFYIAHVVMEKMELRLIRHTKEVLIPLMKQVNEHEKDIVKIQVSSAKLEATIQGFKQHRPIEGFGD